jgi:sulfate-transporting ATPase
MSLLAARDLSAGYHDVAAIRGIDLEVEQGEVVLLAGANGAGKTTTIMALAGALRPLAGHVELSGERTTAPLHRRCQGAMGIVTEERTIFRSLSVRENLRLGRGEPSVALEHFPELGKRLSVRAGLLSGGEQQMLSLARVIAAKPQVILADELSLGLAPIVVERLLVALRAAADAGAGVLLVEQQVRRALDVADRVYVLRRGLLAGSGTAESMRADETALRSLYL